MIIKNFVAWRTSIWELLYWPFYISCDKMYGPKSKWYNEHYPISRVVDTLIIVGNIFKPRK